MKTKYNKELSIKRLGTGSYLISEKETSKKHWFEKFYDFMSNFIFGGKRTVLALIILISLNMNAQIDTFKIKKGWSYIYVSEQNQCKNIEKTVYVLDIKNNYVIFSYRYGLVIDRFEKHYMKYHEFLKMVTNQKQKPYKVYTKLKNQI